MEVSRSLGVVLPPYYMILSCLCQCYHVLIADMLTAYTFENNT